MSIRIGKLQSVGNKSFVYFYIYPAIVMLAVLWTADTWLSAIALISFSAYTYLICNAASLHISAKVFCVLSIGFMVIYEFVVVPAGRGPAKTLLYVFLLLSLIEIAVLKIARYEPGDKDRS